MALKTKVKVKDLTFKTNDLAYKAKVKRPKMWFPRPRIWQVVLELHPWQRLSSTSM